MSGYSLCADLALLDGLYTRLGAAQILRELEVLEREKAKVCGLRLELQEAADHLERAGYLRAALTGLDGLAVGTPT